MTDRCACVALLPLLPHIVPARCHLPAHQLHASAPAFAPGSSGCTNCNARQLKLEENLPAALFCIHKKWTQFWCHSPPIISHILSLHPLPIHLSRTLTQSHNYPAISSNPRLPKFVSFSSKVHSLSRRPSSCSLAVLDRKNHSCMPVRVHLSKDPLLFAQVLLALPSKDPRHKALHESSKEN